MMTKYITHDKRVTIYSYPRGATPDQVHGELRKRMKGDYHFTVAKNRTDIRANGLLELIPEDIDFRSKNIIFVKRSSNG